jgi:hypothetical protein
MTDGLRMATEKMRAAGVTDTAIAIFADYYAQLVAGTTGLVPEESIAPIGDVTRLEDVASDPRRRRRLRQDRDDPAERRAGYVDGAEQGEVLAAGT